MALYGLLFAVVILFALQGKKITAEPADVARIALPLLAYFAIMWAVGFAVSRLHLSYPRTAALAFSAASNDFELAIAVAIGVFGVTSGQALAGVVGPLMGSSTSRSGGNPVNCFDCAARGDQVPAVAVCADCGAAVCHDHAHVTARWLTRTAVINRIEAIEPPPAPSVAACVRRRAPPPQRSATRRPADLIPGDSQLQGRARDGRRHQLERQRPIEVAR